MLLDVHKRPDFGVWQQHPVCLIVLALPEPNGPHTAAALVQAFRRGNFLGELSCSNYGFFPAFPREPEQSKPWINFRFVRHRPELYPAFPIDCIRGFQNLIQDSVIDPDKDPCRRDLGLGRILVPVGVKECVVGDRDARCRVVLKLLHNLQDALASACGGQIPNAL